MGTDNDVPLPILLLRALRRAGILGAAVRSLAIRTTPEATPIILARRKENGAFEVRRVGRDDDPYRCPDGRRRQEAHAQENAHEGEEACRVAEHVSPVERWAGARQFRADPFPSNGGQSGRDVKRIGATGPPHRTQEDPSSRAVCARRRGTICSDRALSPYCNQQNGRITGQVTISPTNGRRGPVYSVRMPTVRKSTARPKSVLLPIPLDDFVQGLLLDVGHGCVGGRVPDGKENVGTLVGGAVQDLAEEIHGRRRVR